MPFNHYYQSELSALRQLGRRFSERNPALAPYLGQAGQDPDVERLLEGFAFLTGRLREKLDDELPELSHSLMNLLWPNYMRPLPSFSILQFDPLSQAAPARSVPRDTPVQSQLIDGVRCQFRTCYATQVQALELKALDYSVTGGGALLGLTLQVTGKGHLGALALNQLRLHLTGERYISQALYLSLLRHVASVELVPLGEDGRILSGSNGATLAVQLPCDCVRPVGFDEDQALIPYPLNTFRGYRFLQEYFAFQDKFLFVDIHGLDALAPSVLEQARGVQLRLDLRGADMARLRPTLDNLKLHCTPIVNLFTHDATPVRLDARQDEFLVLPAVHATGHCGVYTVESVTGSQTGRLSDRVYVPFESFEHDPSFDVPQQQPHYSVRQRTSQVHDGLDTYLSFGLSGGLVGETLSIELTCTNQDLPRQLPLGAIDERCDGTPDFLRFRNIVPATPSYAPPLGRDFLWKLISNMSLNYLSLNNVDALKVILETYDIPRHYDQHAARVSTRMLGGLQAIRHESVDRLYRGLPVRGLRTHLSIEPKGFIGNGDLFLFASVLNEFFALYASLNSYHELQVTTTQGEVYQWTSRMGQQPLL